VQALRGLATLGVLLAHLFMVEGKYSPDQLMGEWSNLGHWGVDIFFVISGFIMVYVTWNGERGWGQLPSYLFRRVSRIYPLYWIVSAAVLVVWLWRPDMVFASNRPDILRSFALFPAKNQPLLAVGWTLVFEMYFYLVFGLLLIFPRRWLLPLLGLWALAVGVGWHMLDPLPEEAVLRHVFNPLTFEFIAGAVFGVAYVRGFKSVPHNVIFAVIGVAVALLGVVYVTQPDMQAFIGMWGLRVSLFGFAALMAFAAMVLSGYQAGRVPVWLGDISYSLYLTHVLSLTVVGRLAQPHLREGYADNVALIAVMIVAALVVGHLTYVLIERPIINWFKRRRRSQGRALAAH